jgi:hypothetical protein
MPRGKPTDPELLAEVAAALLAGMAQSEAVQKYNLPPRTVARLAANLGPKLAEVGSKKLDAIGDMLVDLIHANTQAMIAVTRVAHDAHYLKTHGPGAIADLYSQFADTTIRLLEAAGPVAEAQQGAATDAVS